MHVRQNIQILFWFNFFSAFKLYSAFAVIYFTKITGSVALGISVLSAVQIANAAFELPTGFLSDAFGRKKVIFLGALTQFFSLLCYAMTESLSILFIGSVLGGLALALFSGNNEALLYDSLNQIGEKNSYHRYFGQIKSMAYPALIIASLLGGAIASISFPLVFWLSLVPQSICVLLTLFIIEPERQTETPKSLTVHFKAAFKLLNHNIQLRRISIAEIYTQGIEEVLFQLQLLFYNTLWPVWAVGLTRSIMAIGKFVSFRYSSTLINRFHARSLLVFNTTITRIIHIFSLLFPTLASPIFMTSTGFLWGSIEVSRNKLLQEQFSSGQRATMSSFLSFLGSIFAGVLGLVVGAISDKLGVINTLLLLQIFFIPVIFLYIQYSKQDKKEKNQILSN